MNSFCIIKFIGLLEAAEPNANLKKQFLCYARIAIYDTGGIIG